MKLKKIAALALAGVMAVSMLAGCSGGSNKTESGVNTAAVIAALSKDNKVTFSADAKLQAAADKAAGYITSGAVKSDLNLTLLNQADSNIATSETTLPAVDTATTDVKTQEAGVFVVKSSLVGASDEATIKDLVNEIEKKVVAGGSQNVTTLSAESKQYTDDNTKENYKFTFAYTGDIAVTSTTNENGQVTYYAVFNVTRTPTRVAVGE